MVSLTCSLCCINPKFGSFDTSICKIKGLKFISKESSSFRSVEEMMEAKQGFSIDGREAHDNVHKKAMKEMI